MTQIQNTSHKIIKGFNNSVQPQTNQKLNLKSNLSTIQGESEQSHLKTLRGDQLQFNLLTDPELKSLHKQTVASISSKYKTSIRNLKDKYDNLIEERRKRVSGYITKIKRNFRTLIFSLNKWCRLEVDFINYKAKQLNYDNVIMVFRIWVISIIGDLRK